MHENYPPSQILCGYLLRNTSTEFPVANARRALRCMGWKFDESILADDHRPPLQGRSSRINGKPVKASIAIELAVSTKDTPSTLMITARR